MCWFIVWHEPANPPLQNGNEKKEMSAIKRIYNKKHSLIESVRTERHAMSKVEDSLALSLSKTQARMPMRSRDTILHISSKDKDEEMPLHHGMHPCVNKHQSMVDYRLCVMRP
jgi:hypothetical protein